MKIFNKIIIVLSAAILSVTALVGCGEKQTNCETGWKVARYTASEEGGQAEDVSQFVCFDITRNSEAIDSVWINVSDFLVDETIVEYGKYSTSGASTEYKFLTSDKGSFTLDKTAFNGSENGWIKLVGDWGVSSSYIKIAFTGGFTINEAVFLNAKGEKFTAALYAAKVIYRDDKSNVVAVVDKKDKLEGLPLGDSSPLKLLDEQDKFDNK